MWKFQDDNLGEIREREHGQWFTYRASKHHWGLQHSLPHEIDVLDGTRAARVLGTVAYIAVDEAEDGTPVLQKWNLSKHIVYPAR